MEPKSEQPLNSLSTEVYGPDTRIAVGRYKEADNERIKLTILNRDIVQPESGVATQSQLSAVRGLAIAEMTASRGVGYVPEVISMLTPENEMALINAMHITIEDTYAQVVSAVAERARAMTDKGKEQLESEAAVTDSLYRDFAERLSDPYMDSDERRELIASIDRDITPQALRAIIADHPEAYAAMLRSREEFGNSTLRQILKRSLEADEAPLQEEDSTVDLNDSKSSL